MRERFAEELRALMDSHPGGTEEIEAALEEALERLQDYDAPLPPVVVSGMWRAPASQRGTQTATRG